MEPEQLAESLVRVVDCGLCGYRNFWEVRIFPVTVLNIQDNATREHAVWRMMYDAEDVANDFADALRCTIIAAIKLSKESK
jgi:hypothetical protein